MKKKSTFIFILSIGVSVAIINSSFKEIQIDQSNETEMVCNGPFYSTNILGANFIIAGKATGVPGQGTCNNCHTTYSHNSGPGILTLDIGGGSTQFVPDQTYSITVTISQSSITAFDFQITNRDQSANLNAVGNFIITDSTGTTRTQLTGGGSYVEGTACGIDAISAGYNKWTFHWKAPSFAIGNITFYVGAIAANFNNQNTGDYTYSKTLVLQATTGIQNPDVLNNFNLYPNPAKEYFAIDYSLKTKSTIIIKLFDVRGMQIDTLLSAKANPGEYHHVFNLSGNGKHYAAGIYFIQTNADNQINNYKLFIR